jgi:hypothetical protein
VSPAATDPEPGRSPHQTRSPVNCLLFTGRGGSGLTDQDPVRAPAQVRIGPPYTPRYRAELPVGRACRKRVYEISCKRQRSETGSRQPSPALRFPAESKGVSAASRSIVNWAAPELS